MARSPWPDPSRALLVVLLLVVAGALVFAASTSSVAFGSYNPSWEGTSDLREHAESVTDSRVILDIDGYTGVEPNGTVAFIIAPAEPYEAADAATLERFVTGGGTLVVADNFGPHGNAVLESVGASARFDGDILRDERHYDRNPRFPVANNVTTHPYTTDVEQLTLNHGTAVDPGTATPIVRTSAFAYRDENRTDELDGDDEMAAYPVVTVESIGAGTVVAVGDPSVFINTMLEAPDNTAFATALLSAHDRALLDYSHAGTHPPLAVALLTLRETPLLQFIVGVVFMLGAWAFLVRRGEVADEFERFVASRFHGAATYFGLADDAERNVRTDPEALATYLERQYPNWEEERISRIIAGTLRDTDPESSNE